MGLIKKLRIQAINDSPISFKFSPDEAMKLEDSYWQHCLSDDHWLVGTIDNHVVAMDGIMPLKDDKNNFEIASVWIALIYRGSGVFEPFAKELEHYAHN
jgi:hypothetical protein